MPDILRHAPLPVLAFLVYFIYPIPHTIALRNTLLILISGYSLVLMRNSQSLPKQMQRPSDLLFAGYLLGILTLWLVIQSIFLSPYSAKALEHLRGDWLVTLLVTAIGGCTVLACRPAQRHLPIAALSGALFLHVLILLAYQCVIWISSGSFPFGLTPFAQKDYHSMLVTTLVALLLTDLLSRSFADRTLIAAPRSLILVALLLTCVASVSLTARNAFIITLLLLLTSAGIYLARKTALSTRKILPIALILIVSVAAVGWIAVRSDTRWQSFSESAQAALDTEHNLAWLDEQKYPRPLMRDGQQVDHSAYMRLAWGKIALEQILNYPLGLGYGHQAFGWAINRSYNTNTLQESSHCGLLDFTLANGIPGLLLWLALSAMLIRSGWRAFKQQQSVPGLAVAFSVSAYLLRSLLDGHLSGFRLEMYAFLVGLLVSMQWLEKKPCN